MTKIKLMNQKRVIEVAATLFLEKGFAYTSMDELVRVSKVSKSNVYYHFSNKEVLLEGSLIIGLKCINLQLMTYFLRTNF